MITLDLTTADKETLIEVLENYLSDLRMEISHTDRLDFRNKLRERKRVLIEVVEALAGQSEQAA